MICLCWSWIRTVQQAVVFLSTGTAIPFADAVPDVMIRTKVVPAGFLAFGGRLPLFHCQVAKLWALEESMIITTQLATYHFHGVQHWDPVVSLLLW